MAASIKEYLIATRPWSFSASVVAVLVGSAVAWKHSTVFSFDFSYFHFILTLLGAILMQTSGNLINTYSDFKSGLDKKDTSSDRTFFDTKVRPQDAKFLAWFSFLLAGVIGVYFVLTSASLDLFLLFISGAALSFFYTSGPLPLKWIALGDVVIFLCYGPLMVEGTYFLQAHRFSWQNSLPASSSSAAALLLSFPVGFLTEAILHVNNTRDIVTDRKAGAKTVPQLLGHKLSFLTYCVLIIGPYIWLLSMVLLNKASSWSLFLLPLLSLPPSLSLLKAFNSKTWGGETLCATTGQQGLMFSLLLSIAVLWSPPF
jgi:1,4-dihydroxy-2-naphthoate octaprenyltransferase